MHHLSLEPHQLLGQLLAEQRHRARQAFRRMVDAGLLSIEQEVAGLRHHHRRQKQAQLLCIPQPGATKRGARLAGEITGLASLAQPPGPNHTLAHTGAVVLQWAGLMQQRFKIHRLQVQVLAQGCQPGAAVHRERRAQRPAARRIGSGQTPG